MSQNHAYANKSRNTYVCDICQLSDPDYIKWIILKDVNTMEHFC